MNNFADMLSKAKAMQDKMKEAQDKIKKIEHEIYPQILDLLCEGQYHPMS